MNKKRRKEEKLGLWCDGMMGTLAVKIAASDHVDLMMTMIIAK